MSNKNTYQPIDAQLIIKIVVSDLGILMDDLLSKHRYEPLPMARAMIVHALRSCTDLSFPDIAWKLHKRNHSTIMTANDRLLAGDYDQAIKAYIPQAIDARDYTRWVCNRAREASQEPTSRRSSANAA
ncbi:hypothetical protein COB72_03335 [bacterium]|nr:MAG: hypothetical protein COB72_03335 [bacterium]